MAVAAQSVARLGIFRQTELDTRCLRKERPHMRQLRRVCESERARVSGKNWAMC